jgi:hypothetical protein
MTGVAPSLLKPVISTAARRARGSVTKVKATMSRWKGSGACAADTVVLADAFDPSKAATGYELSQEGKKATMGSSAQAYHTVQAGLLHHSRVSAAHDAPEMMGRWHPVHVFCPVHRVVSSRVPVWLFMETLCVTIGGVLTAE